MIDVRVRESFERQGLMRRLGAALSEGASGRCVIETEWGDHLTQQHGYFHGGVSAALADAAAGHAAISVAPPGTTILTVEFKICFMAPADGVRLQAVAEVLRAGRTLIIARASVFVQAGEHRHHCAECLATLIVLEQGERGLKTGRGDR